MREHGQFWHLREGSNEVPQVSVLGPGLIHLESVSQALVLWHRGEAGSFGSFMGEEVGEQKWQGACVRHADAVC